MPSLGNFRSLMLLTTLIIFVATTEISGDGLSLRERIADRLASMEFATKAPVITGSPTNKKTATPTFKKTKSPLATLSPSIKATKSPTAKPTKRDTSAPTLFPTKKLTSAPTRKLTVSPTKKSTGVPTLKTTKSPVVSISPSRKATKSPGFIIAPSKMKSSISPSAKQITSAPSASKAPSTVAISVVSNSVASSLTPTSGSSDSPSTPQPTNLDTSSRETSTPSSSTTESPGNQPTEKPTVLYPETGSPSANSGLEVTNAPSQEVIEPTQSPSNMDAITASPAAEQTGATSGAGNSTQAPLSDEDSSTLAPTEFFENATDLPPQHTLTQSPVAFEPSVNVTQAPAVPEPLASENVTQAPVAPGPLASEKAPSGSQVNLTQSPTVFAGSSESQNSTLSPSAAGSGSETPTVATLSPTATVSLPLPSNSTLQVDDNSSGLSAINNTLKSSLLNLFVPSDSSGILNWTAAADAQLWLVKVTGIKSRSAATAVLLALQRLCFGANNFSSVEISEEISAINNFIVPALKSNRTVCDQLLMQRDGDPFPAQRLKLEFASASCARATRAQEKLIDVSNTLISKNASSQACTDLVNPQLLELGQYDVQFDTDQISVLNIVLASLAIALGVFLLLMHPLANFRGTFVCFLIAVSYPWAYAVYTASWFCFNLSEAETYLSGTWWREYYAAYLLGLAGWLLFACLTAATYFFMVRNPWLLGIWAGIAAGCIFGIQVNTIGAWQLGYLTYQSPYLTLAFCMGIGALLYALILAIVGAVSPTTGSIQHFAIITIGAYLFIKGIGVLAGSYPNEFDMSPPSRWETYAYIVGMWVVTILAFVVQALLYGIMRPWPVAESRAIGKPEKGGSGRNSRSSGTVLEDERVPLLPPVGLAADSRNMARQQEVSEFGGVRALRPDSENRRLYV